MVQRALVIVLVVAAHLVHAVAARRAVHAIVRGVVGAVALVQLVHLELGRFRVWGTGRGGRRRSGQQSRNAERMVSRRVRWLLLEASAHDVLQTRRIGQ